MCSLSLSPSPSLSLSLSLNFFNDYWKLVKIVFTILGYLHAFLSFSDIMNFLFTHYFAFNLLSKLGD